MTNSHLLAGIKRLEEMLVSQRVFQQALFNAASQKQTPDQKLATETLNDLCNITNDQVSAALQDLRQQVLIDAYNSIEGAV